MNFIKRYFFNKYISENKRERSVGLIPLHRARHVGIICDITTEDTYKEIYSVFSSLPTVQRSVWLVGYIHEKAVPFYCLQQLTADFFCAKDLNWYGRPEKGQVKEFMDTEFDILIDFSQESYPALLALLALSRAHLIVGGAASKAAYYDLHINTPYRLSHRDLINQIEYYTKKLAGES